MSAIELLLVSGVSGLSDALAGYEGVQVSSNPSPLRAIGLINGPQPPHAIYTDDSVGTLDDLWSLIGAARARRIPVVVGVQGVALGHMADLTDSGLAVTDLRDAGALASWIAQQLGLRRRAAGDMVMIAVAGAKGGIGKSLVVALLAEGMRRRGLRVLVVDGDLSNSGVVPTFRIPSGFPSYLHILGDSDARMQHDAGTSAAWSAQNVRRYVYHHQASTIDFLLGSEETTDPRDMQRPAWLALMQAVRGLREYDVVLIDTGPEIKKRPYAILTARDGGWVVLPAPPGRKERTGVGNMLRVMQTAVADRDLTDRCLMLYMEPEQGVTVTIDQVAPLFTRHFPAVRSLGRLPRAPHQVSIADEEGDRYIAPLDVAPHSKFTRAAHLIVDQLCKQVGLHPPYPMPKSSWIQRLRGERIVLRPQELARIGAEG